MKPKPPLFWTEQRAAELCRLVAGKQHTFREIGAMWGVTRNVPIGKAHRLGLGDPEPTTTLGRLDAVNRFPAPGGCCFPIGHPKQPDFTFCAAPVVAYGEPYCPEHTLPTHIAGSAAASRAQLEWLTKVKGG